MYDIVLFDLDGTITQSESGIFKSARYALAKFGIEETDEKNLRRFIGPPLYYSFSRFYGLEGEDGEKAVGYFQEIYEKDGYKDVLVYDGIKEILKEIRDAGKTLIIVTFKPLKMAERVIEHIEINSFFDAVIGPSQEMVVPSKTELINRAIKLSGSEGKRAVMIGDRKSDIDGACEAGIDSIGVLYGYGSKEEFENSAVTYLVNTPEEIKRLVLT